MAKRSKVIPILSSTYTAPHFSQASNHSLTNFYLQNYPGNGERQGIMAIGTPGSTSYINLSGSIVRAMISHPSGGYVCVDDKIYKLTALGTGATSSLIGTLTGTISHVTFSASESDIVVCTGAKLFRIVTASGAFTDISSAVTSQSGSPTPIATLFNNGFFLYLSNTSSKVWVSDVLAPQTVGAFGVFQILADRGTLSAGAVTSQYVFLLTAYTTEVWQITGGTPQPFSRASSGILPIGTDSKETLQTIGNELFFLGRDSDGLLGVVRTDGQSYTVASTPDFVNRVKQYLNPTDAFAFTEVIDGHQIYTITFRQSEAAPGYSSPIGETWCFDVSTNVWFRRTSFNSVQSRIDRYVGNCQMFFNNAQLVGDFQTGYLYSVSSDYFTDNGNPITSEIISPNIINNNHFFSLTNLEVDMEKGQGLVSGTGSDPQLMLSVSKDGGNTYGNETSRSCTPRGQFKPKIKWASLGGGYKFKLRFKITDPIRRNFYGITAQINGQIIE